MLQRLPCLVRGGHRWETVTDAAGHVTVCGRCGALRHTTTSSVEESSFRMHTDVAADYSRPPTAGSDALGDPGGTERSREG